MYIDSGLVFEALMENARNSVGFLVDFLDACKDDKKFPCFIAEFDAFMAKTAEEVNNI